MKNIPLIILLFAAFGAQAQYTIDEFKQTDFYYDFLNAGKGAQQRMEQGKTIIHYRPAFDMESDFFVILEDGVFDYMELKFSREYLVSRGPHAKNYFLSFALSVFCDSAKTELKPFLAALTTYDPLRGENFNFEQAYYGRLEEAELKTSQCTIKLDNDPNDLKVVVKWD